MSAEELERLQLMPAPTSTLYTDINNIKALAKKIAASNADRVACASTQPSEQGDDDGDDNREVITACHAIGSQRATNAGSFDVSHASTGRIDVDAYSLPAKGTIVYGNRKGEKLGDWEGAFKKIRASPRLKTIDQVRDVIRRQSFGDSDVIVEERPKLTLICPISGKRIETAARGGDCTHLHCFDLAAFLKQQSQTPFWDCPFSFCEQKVRLEDIVIDEYFNHALQATDAAVKEIELLADGSFLPVEMPKVVPDEVDDTDDCVDARKDDDPHANTVHVFSAEVLRELDAALKNVGDRLKKMAFAYLSRVKESFNGLHGFACEHFFFDETINELGSRECLNGVAHDLVALNSIVKQRVIGAPKLIL